MWDPASRIPISASSYLLSPSASPPGPLWPPHAPPLTLSLPSPFLLFLSSHKPRFETLSGGGHRRQHHAAAHGVCQRGDALEARATSRPSGLPAPATACCRSSQAARKPSTAGAARQPGGHAAKAAKAAKAHGHTGSQSSLPDQASGVIRALARGTPGTGCQCWTPWGGCWAGVLLGSGSRQAAQTNEQQSRGDTAAENDSHPLNGLLALKQHFTMHFAYSCTFIETISESRHRDQQVASLFASSLVSPACPALRPRVREN